MILGYETRMMGFASVFAGAAGSFADKGNSLNERILNGPNLSGPVLMMLQLPANNNLRSLILPAEMTTNAFRRRIKVVLRACREPVK